MAWLLTVDSAVSFHFAPGGRTSRVRVVVAAHLDRLETELDRIHSAVDSLRSILETPESAVVIENRTTGRADRAGHAVRHPRS
jgi:hypothetical protein